MERDGIQLRHVHVIDPDKTGKHNGQGYENKAYEGPEVKNIDNNRSDNTFLFHIEIHFKVNVTSTPKTYIKKCGKYGSWYICTDIVYL